MLRVLLLAPDFPPAHGGIQTALAAMAAHLDGVQLTVLAPRLVGDAAFDRAQSYRVVRVALRDASGRRAIGGAPTRLLRRWLRPALPLAQTCDVLWCGHAFALPLTYALGRLCRRPYVLHAYAAELAYTGWAGAGLGWLARRAARCMAISGYAAAALRRLGVPPERIAVAPLGVADPPEWPPLAPRVAAATAGAGPVLLTVGRLVRRKGHDLVLYALPRLRSTWPRLRYLVAGDGPAAGHLRALAEQLGVGAAVRFLGAVDASELAACYQACDVFVLPARDVGGDAEGFGLVYLEAGAYGKPVVAARSGGAVDAVVAGVTGLLVPPNNAAALVAALRLLLATPALAARLGAQGRERARSVFTWQRAAVHVRAVLEAACASSTTTTPAR